MEFKEIRKHENPLFNRKEVEVIVETHSSLKVSEAEQMLAEKYSSSPENIKVKKIAGKFGSKKFLITANIYHTKEDKEKIEQKAKTKKAAVAPTQTAAQ